MIICLVLAWFGINVLFVAFMAYAAHCRHRAEIFILDDFR